MSATIEGAAGLSLTAKFAHFYLLPICIRYCRESVWSTQSVVCRKKNRELVCSKTINFMRFPDIWCRFPSYPHHLRNQPEVARPGTRQASAEIRVLALFSFGNNFLAFDRLSSVFAIGRDFVCFVGGGNIL